MLTVQLIQTIPGNRLKILQQDKDKNLIKFQSTQVETTQEKIISLELTTSPCSETAPDLGEAGISLGEGEVEGGEHSLQPDIVQVVNPLLDGGAGQVTAIAVGPADRVTPYTETAQ